MCSAASGARPDLPGAHPVDQPGHARSPVVRVPEPEPLSRARVPTQLTTGREQPPRRRPWPATAECRTSRWDRVGIRELAWVRTDEFLDCRPKECVSIRISWPPDTRGLPHAIEIWTRSGEQLCRLDETPCEFGSLLTGHAGGLRHRSSRRKLQRCGAKRQQSSHLSQQQGELTGGFRPGTPPKYL